VLVHLEGVEMGIGELIAGIINLGLASLFAVFLYVILLASLIYGLYQERGHGTRKHLIIAIILVSILFIPSIIFFAVSGL